ncbi:MAG: endolytic transglycosylase MltG [Tistlia sp.]|uniref:endolytic transglycosylase MltG n=1 Tax=Tistlia sp. TaxID=3057121 RepID=UPI0034A55DD0
MRRLLTTLLVLIALTGAGLYLGYQWALERYREPGPLAQETRVVIRQGSGLEAISRELEAAGVIADADHFRIAARATEQARRLKAGEYAFTPGISLKETLDLLESGKTVVRRLTVPEGLTSVEVVALLGEAEGLTGELAEVPPEGSLLPETYHYSWGESRQGLLQRMQADFEKALEELWRQRAEDLPIETPQEAVVLASIVEKETGVAEERPLVASVFVNRLRKGMPLQSDPTVSYALTEGRAPLGRELTRADWLFESPYNTYRQKGLPPGPIANPGRSALAAVLDPADSGFLYFVADGSGGHAFASSLAEHNRNVANWRRVKRDASR